MKTDWPILIVDDEVEMRIALSATLKRAKYEVELSHNALDAMQKIQAHDYALVLSDMTMPKRSGIELLKDIKKLKPNLPVMIMTAHGTVETAVEAMKQGAFDYILKPFDFDTVVFLVERALSQKIEAKAPLIKPKVSKSAKESLQRSSYKEIITENPAMLELLNMVKSVAKSKATIMIQSESGTGKELLAHFIHQNSNRASEAFVAVNCAALPESLLESELFGHKKGSFTGAIQDHKGKFEQADKGTILLDEISEMSLPLQAKLLRVLQEHKVDKIGGTEALDVDIRVVATTNRNLLEYVDSGKFREDLYFRLNVIPVSLPPLRHRLEDIPILARFFVQKHALLNQIEEKPIKQEVFKVLKAYHWRGNVRELENVMERATLLSQDADSLEPSHLLIL